MPTPKQPEGPRHARQQAGVAELTTRALCARCVQTSATSQFHEGAARPSLPPARGGVAKAPQRLPAHGFVKGRGLASGAMQSCGRVVADNDW